MSDKQTNSSLPNYGEEILTGDDCITILNQVENTLTLLGYLDFSKEEISSKAAVGLMIMHNQLMFSVDRASAILAQESKPTPQVPAKTVNSDELVGQAERAVAMLSSLVKDATDDIDHNIPALQMSTWYGQLYKDFLKALNNLEATKRDVFILHRYEHFTFEEIASSLAISEDDVAAHLENVLGVFRDMFRQSTVINNRPRSNQ